MSISFNDLSFNDLSFNDLPKELHHHITTFLDAPTRGDFTLTCKAYSHFSFWSERRICEFLRRYCLESGGNPQFYQYHKYSDRFNDILANVSRITLPVLVAIEKLELFRNCTAIPLDLHFFGDSRISDTENLKTFKCLQNITSIVWCASASFEVELKVLLPKCTSLTTVQFAPKDQPFPDLSTSTIAPSETVKNLFINGIQSKKITNSCFITLLKLFPSLESLEVIDFDTFGFGELEIKDIELPALKKMSLRYCCGLKINDLVAICKACPKLEEIDICGCNNISEFETHALPSLPGITKLTLGQTSDLTPEDLDILLTVVFPKIQNLTFIEKNMEEIDEDESFSYNCLDSFLSSDATGRQYESITSIILDAEENGGIELLYSYYDNWFPNKKFPKAKVVIDP